MNLTQHPDTLDRIAAHYALGTLRGGARRRFEALAREHSVVRAAALGWQTRLSAMTELQEQAAPSPAVWTRIDNLARADREMAKMQRPRAAASPPASPRLEPAKHAQGWWHSLLLWRGAALASLVATTVVLVAGAYQREQLGAQVAALQTQLQAAPQISYVAVLSDEKSSASMLVTFDPKNNTLVLQRVGEYREAGDKSLQLWALPPAGGPRSLGVLGQDRVMKLAAAAGDVRQVPTLAISLEPKGGVPGTGGPTGPVLFKGTLIERAL